MSIIAKTRESTTMQLLLVPLAAITWKYIMGDSTMGVGEYAQAYGVLMAIWLGREWRSAHYKDTE